jgi:hypothetical protein
MVLVEDIMPPPSFSQPIRTCFLPMRWRTCKSSALHYCCHKVRLCHPPSLPEHLCRPPALSPEPRHASPTPHAPAPDAVPCPSTSPSAPTPLPTAQPHLRQPTTSPNPLAHTRALPPPIRISPQAQPHLRQLKVDCLLELLRSHHPLVERVLASLGARRGGVGVQGAECQGEE